MSLHLPLHPTLRHPLTGEPLRAAGVLPNGRVVWPIMGAAPDDDDKDDDDKGGDTGDDDNADDQDDKSGDDGKGFPANTPVAQMKPEEQAAYWQHQSRKHEGRATAYHQAVGGKSPDEVKGALTEAEKLRQQSLTDQERAVEEARKQGAETTAGEFGPRMVRTAFNLLLGDMTEEQRNGEIELLDLSKFLTDSGDVDTAKVRAHAERIAPAAKGQGKREPFDFGAGKRGDGKAATGVSAGAELFASSKKPTST